MKFTEENVAKQMAKALDVDVDDLDVEESHLTDFGEGEAMTVSLGRQEYTVVPDEDVAHAIAIAVVTQDLESEPEIFESNFIESHIDMEALKKYVFDSAMEDDYADDIADDPDRFWEEAESWGLDVPEPEEDEDGDEIMPEPSASDIDDLREAIAEDRAKDPMSYFEDIYGDEATKYAIKAVGIDVEGAAEEVVSVDGWQHFLARYDGNSYETSEGFVYWRDN